MLAPWKVAPESIGVSVAVGLVCLLFPLQALREFNAALHNTSEDVAQRLVPQTF